MRLSCTTETAAAVAAQVRGTVTDTGAVQVTAIVEDVRERGDEALLEYEDTFSDNDRIMVAPAELAGALGALDADVRAGLELAVANVRKVAEAGLDEERHVELPQGQTVRLREVPVRRAAVYAPGGHPTILAAAALCGVDEVYRMGGAQAIAALAYGTETIRRVDVIVGPGSLWVQEAKRQVSHRVGIDGFAGPSDLTIIASRGADPEPLRLDLLAQASTAKARSSWR